MKNHEARGPAQHLCRIARPVFVSGPKIAAQLNNQAANNEAKV
jgi:hypothetical protein